MKSFKVTNLKNKGIVLNVVSNNPGVTRDEIASQLGLDVGYVSRLLNWLYHDDVVMWTWNKKGKNHSHKKGWYQK